VNRRTGAASLSYGEYEQHGLRVIAVGGNSLSRGLTLEGLCVSYFHRSTQMYDTLLQMGRWFGYRSGYEDLVRIWMPDEAVNWYAHIAEAAEELRGVIRRMQTSRLKPSDFGMRVRAHPDSLLITARNKMRHSSQITRVISISEEGLETARLLADPEVLAGNYRSAVKLVERLASCGGNEVAGANPFWRAVDKQMVVELLRDFVSHPLNVSFHPQDLAEFVARSDDDLLAKWDVVIPQGSAGAHPLTATESVRLQRRRLAVNVERREILVNEKKMRVGSRGVEKAGMLPEQILAAEMAFRNDPENAGAANVPDRAYRRFRSRPLLLLHFLEGEVNGTKFALPKGTALTALGLSFPRLSRDSERLSYRINLVEIRNLLAEEALQAEGEEADEDDSD
jgi:hypothetical protein